jgi:hypothetical protein
MDLSISHLLHVIKKYEVLKFILRAIVLILCVMT